MKKNQIKESFIKVKQDIDYLYAEIQLIKRTLNNFKKNPTLQHKIPTQKENPILQHRLKSQKRQDIDISIGNQGVPTLQPTNQPTNQPTLQHPIISIPTDKISHLKQVSQVVASLDSLKKEVRMKFKKLTKQEMLIYSTIYQLEEQGITPDYSIISEKLNLSEISIRDYIRKIIKKDIPLAKIKDANKVIFSIPKDLKRIASLNTIIQLREL